jgi:hypothetical protein
MTHRYALLIGISHYGEGYSPLPGCKRDVEQMQTVLQDANMGNFEVKTLFEPDPQNLREAIEGFYRGRQRSDVLLLYFSGHGDLDNATGSQLYLSTCHTRKEAKQLVESSAVEAEFLHRHLVNSKSRQKIVILDCCFSGAIANLLKKGNDGVSLAQLQATGTVVLASCSSFEESYQSKGTATSTSPAESIYTRYLVEGIRTGAACRSKADWIVAQDLHEYARSRFQTEFAAAVEPQIIVVEKEGYLIPVAKAPKGDPKVEYTQTVAALLQETNGIIDDLDRHELDLVRDRLELSVEVAQQIEAEQLHPYKIRAEKQAKYAEALQRAKLRGYPFSERTQTQLRRIQTELSLRDEDIAPLLEQAIGNDTPVRAKHSAEASPSKSQNAPPNASPLPHPEPEDDLSSEREIDYTRLRDLLKAKDWQAADDETYEVMIRAVGKESADVFTEDELLNFPCTDLKTIDRLWVKYSGGKWGFSVQKQIWQECDSPTEYNDNWEKFCDRVGWRKNGNWVDYDDLTFDPEKSLPGGFPWFWWGWWGYGFEFFYFGCGGVFSRIETCKV